MKKVLLVFLLLFSAVSFSQSLKDLYGKWSEVNKKNVGSFTFFPDGYAMIIQGENIVDGRNYPITEGVYKGNKGHIKYTVDFINKPYKVKLTVSYNDGKKEIELNEFLEGFIEFVKEDEMLFFLDFDKEKPEKLDPRSPNTIILKKESAL